MSAEAKARTGARALLVLGACVAMTCAITHVASASEPKSASASPELAMAALPSVEYGSYQGTSFGAYLAPTGELIDADGGVDLVFHFNGAMLAEKSWRRSDANAVIVSQAFSTFGSGPYEDAYADRGRFGRIVTEVLGRIATSHHRENLHARRITLVGWSAGCAAIGVILAVPRYFEMVDSVVLLDGLHAQYKLRPGEARGPAKGASRVNVEQLTSMLRFANEATEGKKQLIVTHTSILTTDYATTTETSDALVRELHLTNADADETMFGMHLRTRAHKKNLHVLGFTGQNPEDHMKHLHAVGDIVRTWVTPRLDQLAADEQEQRSQRASR